MTGKCCWWDEEQKAVVKMCWKVYQGRVKDLHSIFAKDSILWIDPNILCSLERIEPWSPCSFDVKHLSSDFCLHHCTEIAYDLLNTKFNNLASVFLLLSHPAAFDSVGFILLQTLSSLYFTEYIILIIPCVSDYSSLSFNLSSFS